MFPNDTAKLLAVAAWMRNTSEWIEGEAKWSSKNDVRDEEDTVESILSTTTELDSFIANPRHAYEFLESVKFASLYAGETNPNTEAGP
jgi:hypothetical protein